MTALCPTSPHKFIILLGREGHPDPQPQFGKMCAKVPPRSTLQGYIIALFWVSLPQLPPDPD